MNVLQLLEKSKTTVLSAEEIAWVEQQLQQYPYFPVARFLLAKNATQPGLQNRLKTVGAIFAPDRNRYAEFLTSPGSSSNRIKIRNVAIASLSNLSTASVELNDSPKTQEPEISSITLPNNLETQTQLESAPIPVERSETIEVALPVTTKIESKASQDALLLSIELETNQTVSLPPFVQTFSIDSIDEIQTNEPAHIKENNEHPPFLIAEDTLFIETIPPIASNLPDNLIEPTLDYQDANTPYESDGLDANNHLEIQAEEIKSFIMFDWRLQTMISIRTTFYLGLVGRIREQMLHYHALYHETIQIANIIEVSTPLDETPDVDNIEQTIAFGNNIVEISEESPQKTLPKVDISQFTPDSVFSTALIEPTNVDSITENEVFSNFLENFFSDATLVESPDSIKENALTQANTELNILTDANTPIEEKSAIDPTMANELNSPNKDSEIDSPNISGRITSTSMSRFIEPVFDRTFADFTSRKDTQLESKGTHTSVFSESKELSPSLSTGSVQNEKQAELSNIEDKQAVERVTSESMRRFINPSFDPKPPTFLTKEDLILESDSEKSTPKIEKIIEIDRETVKVFVKDLPGEETILSDRITSSSMQRFVEPVFDIKPATLYVPKDDAPEPTEIISPIESSIQSIDLSREHRSEDKETQVINKEKNIEGGERITSDSMRRFIEPDFHNARVRTENLSPIIPIQTEADPVENVTSEANTIKVDSSVTSSHQELTPKQIDIEQTERPSRITSSSMLRFVDPDFLPRPGQEVPPNDIKKIDTPADSAPLPSNSESANTGDIIPAAINNPQTESAQVSPTKEPIDISAFNAENEIDEETLPKKITSTSFQRFVMPDFEQAREVSTSVVDLKPNDEQTSIVKTYRVLPVTDSTTPLSLKKEPQTAHPNTEVEIVIKPELLKFFRHKPTAETTELLVQPIESPTPLPQESVVQATEATTQNVVKETQHTEINVSPTTLETQKHIIEDAPINSINIESNEANNTRAQEFDPQEHFEEPNLIKSGIEKPLVNQRMLLIAADPILKDDLMTSLVDELTEIYAEISKKITEIPFDFTFSFNISNNKSEAQAIKEDVVPNSETIAETLIAPAQPTIDLQDPQNVVSEDKSPAIIPISEPENIPRPQTNQTVIENLRPTEGWQAPINSDTEVPTTIENIERIVPERPRASGVVPRAQTNRISEINALVEKEKKKIQSLFRPDHILEQLLENKLDHANLTPSAASLGGSFSVSDLPLELQTSHRTGIIDHIKVTPEENIVYAKVVGLEPESTESDVQLENEEQIRSMKEKIEKIRTKATPTPPDVSLKKIQQKFLHNIVSHVSSPVITIAAGSEARLVQQTHSPITTQETTKPDPTLEDMLQRLQVFESKFYSTPPPTGQLTEVNTPDLSLAEEQAEEVNLPLTLITEQLANQYIQQGHFAQAIKILTQLQLKFPEKGIYFEQKIESLKK